MSNSNKDFSWPAAFAIAIVALAIAWIVTSIAAVEPEITRARTERMKVLGTDK